MTKLGYKTFSEEENYLEYRKYFTSHGFHWNMNDKFLTTKMLYGSLQRNNWKKIEIFFKFFFKILNFI